MIDWLASKAAMTLGAFLLLASLVTFFVAHQDRAVHDSLQGIADRAAGFLREVSQGTSEGNSTVSIGGSGTLTLPDLAAGRRYTLTFHRAYVVVAADGQRAFGVLESPIHFFQPLAGTYTPVEVAAEDTLHPTVTIGYLGQAIVSRRFLTVDGSTALETFLFL